MTNPLVQAYLRKRLRELQQRELRTLCVDVRQANKDMEPLRKIAAKRREDARRFNGPTGFTMVGG